MSGFHGSEPEQGARREITYSSRQAEDLCVTHPAPREGGARAGEGPPPCCPPAPLACKWLPLRRPARLGGERFGEGGGCRGPGPRETSVDLFKKSANRSAQWPRKSLGALVQVTQPAYKHWEDESSIASPRESRTVEIPRLASWAAAQRASQTGGRAERQQGKQPSGQTTRHTIRQELGGTTCLTLLV